MTSKKRVIFLDCARALCMIWIVGFWHMQEYTNLSLTGIFFSNITNGVLATFTLISGYFLGQKNISSIQDTVTFYKKRLLRFYPLFLYRVHHF